MTSEAGAISEALAEGRLRCAECLTPIRVAHRVTSEVSERYSRVAIRRLRSHCCGARLEPDADHIARLMFARLAAEIPEGSAAISDRNRRLF